MQLEDLRQSWLNPPEETAPISSCQLDKLLASRPEVVEKMRHSARWETAFTTALVLASPFALLLADTLIYRLYAALMLAMGLGLLYYYYRMLGMLSHMMVEEGNVRVRLQQLAAGLRALLRLYLSAHAGPRSGADGI